MKCKKGLCLICEKEIATPCSHCQKSWTNTEHYTEVQLSWTNGSKMATAVCVDCSKGPVWTANRDEMTQAIWNEWDRLGATYDKAVKLA